MLKPLHLEQTVRHNARRHLEVTEYGQEPGHKAVNRSRNYAGPWRRTPGRLLGTLVGGSTSHAVGVRRYRAATCRPARNMPMRRSPATGCCSEAGSPRAAARALRPVRSWGSDPVPASLRVVALVREGHTGSSCKTAQNGAQEREIAMVTGLRSGDDKAGEFRVRFKYNSEVMFSTEGYKSKASAENAIASIKVVRA